jgi:peptidoglycan/LPS O-acetylase OafA/YrhL
MGLLIMALVFLLIKGARRAGGFLRRPVYRVLELFDMEQSIPLLEESGNSDQPQYDFELEKITQPVASKWRTAWACGKAILPRFMRPRGLRYNPDRIHSTSYLDSLRGYAACAVCMFHMYGYPQDGIMSWPILRLYSAGPAMVNIFFVISGYVLSLRMLKLMRAQQSAQLMDCLASSMFRRYLRLYLPTALATFSTMLMVHLGWCRGDLVLPTWWEQFWDWLGDVGYSSNPFEAVDGWYTPEGFRTKFLDQMWTIPVEFRGSIVLFAFCTATCKLSERARMGVSSLVIFFSYYWEVTYIATFIGGMLIADLSLSWNPSRQSQARLPQIRINDTTHSLRNRGLTIARQGGFIGLFVAGLVLLSQPEDLGIEGPFPFQYLIWAIPSHYGDGAEHFWLSIGAIFTIAALEYSPILQKPLTWGISLYIGELSFGIYAMHNSLLWVLYYGRMAPWKEAHYPDSHSIYIPITIGMAFVVFWAADYFTRIDKKIVASGRWLQNKTFGKWERDP